MRLSMGDMSDCLMDWRISTTVATWMSWRVMSQYWVFFPIAALNNASPMLFLLRLPLCLVAGRDWGAGRERWDIRLTFAPASPPYGAFSSAPLKAPSLSPPRRSCFIWPERVWTSWAETEGTDGRREELSKLAGESGSRRSIFMVRQFAVAISGKL